MARHSALPQRPGLSAKTRDPQPGSPPASRRLPARSLLFYAAATLLFSLLCLVAFAELAMRVLQIEPARHERPHAVVLSGGIATPDGRKLVKVPSRLKSFGVDMGEYVPNSVFRTVYDSNPRGYFDKENGVINTINSLGMRGPEISAEKTTGTFRILGIGDSFTYGAGVRDDDTFLRRLETSLNARKPDARRFEVLNAGVEGYNTRDEITTLEHRWLDLKPDLILIGFYLNDCYSDFTFLNRGEIEGVNRPKPPGLAQYSYLYDFAQHRWQVFRESEEMKGFYQKQFFSQPDRFLEAPGNKQVDWQASKAALARAAEIGRRERIPVAVVIFPEIFQLDEKYPFKAVHAHVATACRSLSLPVLDLFDHFRGHKDRDLWVHPADHHPNEVGHRIAAEAIERFLCEKDLLPSS